MTSQWILIANAARARLMQQQKEGGPLALVQSFDHPASRLRTCELADDQAGRERADASFGGVAFPPRLDPHHKEELIFAHELASELKRGAAAGRCDAITVFAPPRLLGALRAALDESTRHKLDAYDTDLSRVGTAELAGRIADVKAGAGAG